MAYLCPQGFDVNHLRHQVQTTYDRVAREPDGEYHFHRGPEYASRMLGYRPEALATLPEAATRRFAGVGNPLRILDTDPRIPGLRPGDTVLDHACGGGMDLLLAAQRVAPSGRAIGIDLTPTMCDCAMAAAELAGLGEVVQVHCGVYERLPVADESVDVVISNGVVNLAPDKVRVFSEIARVLRPGGRLLLADVVVQRELTAEARCNPDLWAACIAGALVESELVELAAQVGLSRGRIVERFDCFRHTPAQDKVAVDLFVHGVNFYARKEE